MQQACVRLCGLLGSCHGEEERYASGVRPQCLISPFHVFHFVSHETGGALRHVEAFPLLADGDAVASVGAVLVNAFVCMQGLADNLLCGLEHRI